MVMEKEKKILAEGLDKRFRVYEDIVGGVSPLVDVGMEKYPTLHDLPDDVLETLTSPEFVEEDGKVRVSRTATGCVLFTGKDVMWGLYDDVSNINREGKNELFISLIDYTGRWDFEVKEGTDWSNFDCSSDWDQYKQGFKGLIGRVKEFALRRGYSQLATVARSVPESDLYNECGFELDVGRKESEYSKPKIFIVPLKIDLM